MLFSLAKCELIDSILIVGNVWKSMSCSMFV